MLEEIEKSYVRPESKEINELLKKIDNSIATILLEDENDGNLVFLYKAKGKLLDSDIFWANEEVEKIEQKYN